jgi:hypothetical protein
MSTKFEQLLDYLVNEDMEKANELFHEIVVEKSRDIYENLIAEEDDEDMEEAAEDEEMDESMEDEEMDESMEDEEMDESDEELEDSYKMDSGSETGDETDDFGGEISADGDNFDHPADDEHGHEGQEDSAIMDIKNAIAELEAAFAELEQAQGGEEGEMGMDSDFGDEEDGEGEDEMMGMPMENRRVTREYVEKVNHNYGGNTQKQQGQNVGGGTGEKQSAPVEGRSPVSSGKGKPTTGANASNIATHQDHEDQDGTKPHGKVGGLVKSGGEYTGSEWKQNSAPGAHTKGYSKKEAGWPNGGKTAGPVGSGTGDKAGQTSVGSTKSVVDHKIG